MVVAFEKCRIFVDDRSHSVLLWTVSPLLRLVVDGATLEWLQLQVVDSSFSWGISVFLVDLKGEIISFVYDVKALVWVQLLHQSLFLLRWWFDRTVHDFNLVFRWAFLEALDVSISEHVLHVWVGLLIKSLWALEVGDFTRSHLLDGHIPAFRNLVMSQFEGLWGAR